MKRTILTALAALALLFCARADAAGQGGPPSRPQASGARTCAADFDALEAKVRADYAGFRDKTAGREDELAGFTERVRAQAAAAADPAACTAALRQWVGFFRDRHLSVSETRPQPTPAAGADAAGAKRPEAGGAAEVDEGLPALRFYDDGTAVLRLPSFGRSYKAPIDKLVAENRARLLATPYLVVDVRGNGGGWTDAYAAVIPLLYTDPIFLDGMDAWASPGNIALAREVAASDKAPEAMRAQARVLLARMEASPGQFVTFAEDRELRLDVVLPLPRAVAVLVDRQCASTCEQFVLDARQSRKVKVLGARNTGGLLDYGNAAATPLPSGERRAHVPSTRSRRLPASPLDLVGLMPDVRVRKDEPDPVEFARRYLRAGDAVKK